MTPDTDPLFDAALEAEWRSQEHALAQERAQEAPAFADGAEREAYRIVMRALCHPELAQLPDGFSLQVARVAQAHPPPTAASDAWFERCLPWVVTLLFGGAFALYGGLAPDEVRLVLDDRAGWSALLGLALLAARAPLPTALLSRLSR